MRKQVFQKLQNIFTNFKKLEENLKLCLRTLLITLFLDVYIFFLEVIEQRGDRMNAIRHVFLKGSVVRKYYPTILTLK